MYLFEIEEETGVLASFREVGEKHCDADEQHCGVLAHLPQRLDEQTAGNNQSDLTHSSLLAIFDTCHLFGFQTQTGERLSCGCKHVANDHIMIEPKTS